MTRLLAVAAALPLLMQGVQDRSSAPLGRARKALPLPLSVLCKEGIAYLKKGDSKRAARTLAMMRGYSVAYDRRWGTAVEPWCGRVVKSRRPQDLLKAFLLIGYAECLDRLRSLEEDPANDRRLARRRLVAAKASYAVFADFVQLQPGGRWSHSRISAKWIDIASRIPRGRGRDGSWGQELSKDARSLRVSIRSAAGNLQRTLSATVSGKVKVPPPKGQGQVEDRPPDTPAKKAAKPASRPPKPGGRR